MSGMRDVQQDEIRAGRAPRPEGPALRWSRRAPRTPAHRACPTGAAGCRSCRRRPARWANGPTTRFSRRVVPSLTASSCVLAGRADTSASYWKSRARARISADDVFRVLPRLVRERFEPLGPALDRRLAQLIDQGRRQAAQPLRQRRSPGGHLRSTCTGGRVRTIHRCSERPAARRWSRAALPRGTASGRTHPRRRRAPRPRCRPGRWRVTETIAAFDPRCRSRRMPSSPPMPGMRRSMSTRSRMPLVVHRDGFLTARRRARRETQRDNSSSSRSRLVGTSSTISTFQAG